MQLTEIKNSLQSGDLIFISVPSFLFRQVAAASSSWTSHVALILRDDAGDVWVYESAIPVARRVTLESFIARSEDHRYTVIRPRVPLTEVQQRNLRRAADSRLGQWYDLGFDLDAKRIYCSKFVLECYHEATGRIVGRVQTFRELLAENPSHGLAFWRCWFGGFIPWDRRTISPASQLNDPTMMLIADSHPATAQPIAA